ncbi:MAG: glycosyl hydrolase [Patulibacter sp.]
MSGPPLPRVRRLLMLAVAPLLLALATPALMPTPAQARPFFGYGDGRADMFSDRRWLALGLRHVRRLVEFDVRSSPTKLAALDQWMAAAQATGSKPLLAIDRSWTRGREHTRPTVAQYRSLIRWLRTRYRFTQLTPWNEANFRDQPTAKSPRLAWLYYLAARQECAGCLVTSPVVLAGKGVSRSWLTEFQRYERGRIRVWAVHNYGDANRGETTGLRWFESQVRGRIWITEAAGWVQFLGGDYPYDQQRAATAITRIFRTARADPRIDAAYFYQWRGTDDRAARWDSGVLNADGSPRKGYDALVRGLRR